MEQKTISYIGLSIWNSLPDSIKKVNNLNTVKKYCLTWITDNVFMWIRVSVFICVCMSVGVCNIYDCVFLWIIYFHVFFSSFTFYSHYCSDLRYHNKNKTFLPVLCYPSYNLCYSCLSAVTFQLELLYFNF